MEDQNDQKVEYIKLYLKEEKILRVTLYIDNEKDVNYIEYIDKYLYRRKDER